jgi:alanyl-tRNA synthetase
VRSALRKGSVVPGGGGRADFAEAGGKDAAKIDQMLEKARELVREALSAY